MSSNSDIESSSDRSTSPINVRNTPLRRGKKWIPVGAEDCLRGLTFTTCGLQDSLTCKDVQKLAKTYGGRTVRSPSRRVDYIIVGGNPGAVKLKQARLMEITEITEDEFLDMIK